MSEEINTTEIFECLKCKSDIEIDIISGKYVAKLQSKIEQLEKENKELSEKNRQFTGINDALSKATYDNNILENDNEVYESVLTRVLLHGDLQTVNKPLYDEIVELLNQ